MLMNNEPVAYLMIDRNDGNSYIQMGVPTRDEKISHQPYPLYTHPVKEELDTRSYLLGRYDSTKTLTDEEIDAVGDKVSNLIDTYAGRREFARAILRKASEK